MGDGPQVVVTRFCARIGNLGSAPSFVLRRSAGGSRVTLVGKFGGRCERRVKGHKIRLKVNLKVEVESRAATDGIPALL